MTDRPPAQIGTAGPTHHSADPSMDISWRSDLILEMDDDFPAHRAGGLALAPWAPCAPCSTRSLDMGP